MLEEVSRFGEPYSSYLTMTAMMRDFDQFIHAIAHSGSTPLQRWVARQSFLGRSVVAVVPHGMGKTAAAIAICLTHRNRSRRCLIVSRDEAEQKAIMKALSSLRSEGVDAKESPQAKEGTVVVVGQDEFSATEERDSPDYEVAVIDDASSETVKRLMKMVPKPVASVVWLKSSPSRLPTRRNSSSSFAPDRTFDRALREQYHHTILTIEGRSPGVLADIHGILGDRAIYVVSQGALKSLPDDALAFCYSSAPDLEDRAKMRRASCLVFYKPSSASGKSRDGDPSGGESESGVTDDYLRWMGYAIDLDPEGFSLPAAVIVDSKTGIANILGQLESQISFTAEDVTATFRESLLDPAVASTRSTRTENIQPILLIVESPTKARTVASIFRRIGSEKVDPLTVQWTMMDNRLLQVIATQGHVYDLSLDGGFHGVYRRRDSFVPRYGFIKRCKRCSGQVVSKDVCNFCGGSNLVSKKGTMDAVRDLASVNELVLLATDPDSEGEKIAFDIMAYISPVADRVERTEFHEVTWRGLEDAFGSPREVLPGLVQSQVLRRVEDRWLGFELSRRLWDRFGSRRLSAGRAQSPILGWVVDRFRESRQKKNYIVVELESGLTVWLDVTGREDRRDIAKSLEGQIAQVNILSEEIVEVKPRPPYTTDSLLADAYYLLHLVPGSTMRIAQDLFETGLTTYHRTDSTRISSYGIGVAKNYIESKFPGGFRGRSWGEGGAHEAIRATKPVDQDKLSELIRNKELKLSKSLTRYHEGLYGIVFRRFVASQMESAAVRTQKFEVSVAGFKVEQNRRVEVVKKGFTAVVPLRLEPEVSSGPQKVKSTSLKTLPKARLFTSGDLVSEMRRRGIGRPSTYAKLADTILRRRYAFEVHGRIIPTNLGVQVSDYLRSNFAKYVSDETTKALGDKMQQVEDGKEDYQKMLSELYDEVKSMPP